MQKIIFSGENNGAEKCSCSCGGDPGKKSSPDERPGYTLHGFVEEFVVFGGLHYTVSPLPMNLL